MPYKNYMKDTAGFVRNFEAEYIQNYVIMNWKILNQPLGMAGSTGAPTRKESISAAAIAGIISAIAAAGSAAYGAKKSNDAAKKANDNWWREKSSLEAERRKKMNQSWMDTRSGQDTLRILQQQAQRAVRQQQGAAAVAGGTDAAVAIEKELQNQKQADILAQAEANFEDRKENIDASYRGEISRANQGIINSEMAQAEATAQAAGAASSALMQGAQVMAGGGTTRGAKPTTEVGGSPGGGGVTQPASVAKSIKLTPNSFEHQGTKAIGGSSPLHEYAKKIGYNYNLGTLMGNRNNYSTIRNFTNGHNQLYKW